MNTKERYSVILIIGLLITAQATLLLHKDYTQELSITEQKIPSGIPLLMGMVIGVGGSGTEGSGAFGRGTCIDGDGDGAITEEQCMNNACNEEESCIQKQYDCDDTNPNIWPCPEEGQLVATQETCNNNFDDDYDGATDCEDNDCINEAHCKTNAPTVKETEKETNTNIEVQNQLLEFCSNNIDDDLDGLIDCLDEECFKKPYCNTEIEEVEEQKNDETNNKEKTTEETKESNKEELSEEETKSTIFSLIETVEEETYIGKRLTSLNKETRVTLGITTTLLLGAIILTLGYLLDKKIKEKEQKKKKHAKKKKP